MSRGTLRWADSAGAIGAVLASFCCLGVPVIVSALAAVGLSALRNDKILWPLMVISLLVAMWGFATDWRVHRRAGPIALATPCSVALVAGVMFVHGPPARTLIYVGAAGLLLATAWNIGARAACRSRLAEPERVAT